VARTCVRRCPPELRELTQHEWFVVLANGTMALAAALSAMSQAGDDVDLPALSCWTLTKAVLDAGLTPRYRDMTAQLAGAPASADTVTVTVRPWWGDVGAGEIHERTILDLSVNPAPTPSASTAAACVISMGSRKPAAHPFHGGVLALSRPELIDEVDRALGMYAEKGRWGRLGPRLTELPLPVVDIDRHFRSVREHRPAAHASAVAVHDRFRDDEALLGSRSPAPAGHSYFTPLVLRADCPLDAADVAELARLRRVPLGLLPIAPAYAQPALRGLHPAPSHEALPTADLLARRLLFTPTELVGRSPALVQDVRDFGDWLGARLQAVSRRDAVL